MTMNKELEREKNSSIVISYFKEHNGVCVFEEVEEDKLFTLDIDDNLLFEIEKTPHMARYAVVNKTTSEIVPLSTHVAQFIISAFDKWYEKTKGHKMSFTSGLVDNTDVDELGCDLNINKVEDTIEESVDSIAVREYVLKHKDNIDFEHISDNTIFSLNVDDKYNLQITRMDSGDEYDVTNISTTEKVKLDLVTQTTIFVIFGIWWEKRNRV